MSVFVISAVILAFLGLTFGSFVNAAVWRIHRKRARSLLNDRSECVHCHHKLAWNDLIPVGSWLSLRGRCRYCGKPIEDTPLAELGVAAYFLVSFLFWPVALSGVGPIIDFGFWLVYGVILAILFVYDLRYMLLPNKLTYALIGLALVQLAVHVAVHPAGAAVMIGSAVLGVLSIAGIYGLLYAVSRERWVGLGDVKLGVFLGLALGSWRLGILTFLLANLIGCVVILPGLLTRRLTPASRIPFGPFLIAGFFVSMLWGGRIIAWYLSAFAL